ncbi:hypothetical protein BC941DRAFT_178854 [Chlamydoabsidia padenii]|nr:hypothetical protein BC941DRAFT_178854 [Chlamydoabsidia padenii]
MLQKSSRDRDHYTQPCNTQQSTELTQRFEQETLTLLHFFYIVRLAQKGLFDIISQSYPEVEPNALVHLCDKLVGGSLFVVKDPVEKVRSEKRGQVFDLLRKLHDGAPESIADGFSTTFKQVRHLVFDFIDSTTSSSSPFITQQSNLYQDNSIGYKDNMNEQPQQQYPVWVMVPFQGMIGESHLQSTSPASNFTGHQKPKNGSQEQSDEKSHPRRTTGNTTNTTKASSIGNSGTEKRVNGSVTPEEKEPNTRNTMDHDEIKTQQQKDTSHDSNSDTNTPSVKESSITHANDPEQLNTTLSKDMQSPSGWESTRATTSTASSSSWSQGDTDQRKLDETTGDTTKDDEWGSPSIGSDAKPQVWDGRPPDDWNEMRSGGVSDRPWHPTHQRRGGHRGRSSGFRGGGGGGQGRGNYRSQGDEFRGGRGRGGGGPRRGSTNSGWNTTRPPRSD